MKTIIKVILVVVCVLISCVIGFYLGLKQNIYNCEDLYSIASTEALALPNNNILLVKQGHSYGALKIYKRGSTSAHYQWWYLLDGSEGFNSKNVMTGTGKVFEKYKRTKIGEKKYHLEDVGGNLVIKIQDIEINWSAPNWISYSSHYGLSLTDKTSINEVSIINHIGLPVKWTGWRRD